MPDSELIPSGPSFTKIVATLGPATDDPETLHKLVENGASVFRLNFSHGGFEEHAKRLAMIREAERNIGRPLAVLGDLPGPKIRVGRVPSVGIEVRAGQDILFRAGLAEAAGGETPSFPCTYGKIVDEVRPGHRVLINDGSVRALATEAGAGSLRCRVTVGGLITSGKGVNLPDSDISAPAITEKDWECVRFAVDNHLDYLALSFVRRADEVLTLKRALAELCAARDSGATAGAPAPAIPIIAKIEKPQAVERIDEILAASDGLMVARGDLGVEMDLARVPVIQKILIAKAQDYGKPCIVATQMLETMIERPTPTRAEASDVANAIFDRADAVMLSGETAVGKYGPLAVQMMRRIALATESRLDELPNYSTPPSIALEKKHRTSALAHGTWVIVNDVGAKIVAVWSQNGGSARYLSRIGLRVPIIAFSSDPASVRRMALLYGVRPVLARALPEHRSDFAAMVDRYIVDGAYAKSGDPIVVLAGKPFGQAGVVNTIAVRRVGEFVDAEI